MSSKPKEFYTAAEIADIAKSRGIIGLPHTKRGVNNHAQENGWTRLGSDMCRKRAGRGGGVEYHVSLLPASLRTVLGAQAETRALSVQQKTSKEVEVRKTSALSASHLKARARSVMEARAEILTSIEGFAISQSESRAWGIRQFLAAQDQYAAHHAAAAKRDRGEALSATDAALLARPCQLTAQDGFGLSIDVLEKASDRRRAGQIARTTIYDWFKARDEVGVVGLSPIPPKKAAPIHSDFAAFLKFYAIPSKPTASDALSEFLKQNPDSSLQLHQVRYVLRNRMNNIEKSVGREGLLTLRSRLPYVTRTTEDMWPTTVYTADGKTFDAEIADPVTYRPIRPEITTVLDVVTRRVVGIALSRNENTIAVTEALRNACVNHGIPAIFYVDRGAGYKNKAMDGDVGGLMGRLGITKMHALPYGSQAKGRIERPNATIWDVLAKRLPTYIGQDMDKEASQFAHKRTRNEIKEFGQSRLLPTWDDFVRMCEDRVNEYNDKPHRGLPKFQDETGKYRHMTPNEAWASHVEAGFEPVDVSTDEIDDLFRPYELRVVARGEVKWKNNSYFDHALSPYHGVKVMVGYDYHQADKVWVREFDVTSGQPGPLICVAQFMANAARYVPVTVQRQSEERRAAARHKRVDEKKRAIDDELHGLTMIERHDAEVFDLFDHAQPDFEYETVELEASAPASDRLTFQSDEHLAAWALDHPNELTKDQIGVLMDCMSRSTAREVLRMSGIDTEALRTLLRAVA